MRWFSKGREKEFWRRLFGEQCIFCGSTEDLHRIERNKIFETCEGNYSEDGHCDGEEVEWRTSQEFTACGKCLNDVWRYTVTDEFEDSPYRKFFRKARVH